MLVRDGFTQAQVGAALGVDRTSVSRMFPKGMLSSLAKGNDLE
jgi:DNA-binding transcriptional regulator LsrR (DeoR family)